MLKVIVSRHSTISLTFTSLAQILLAREEHVPENFVYFLFIHYLTSQTSHHRSRKIQFFGTQDYVCDICNQLAITLVFCMFFFMLLLLFCLHMFYFILDSYVYSVFFMDKNLLLFYLGDYPRTYFKTILSRTLFLFANI